MMVDSYCYYLLAKFWSTHNCNSFRHNELITTVRVKIYTWHEAGLRRVCLMKISRNTVIFMKQILPSKLHYWIILNKGGPIRKADYWQIPFKILTPCSAEALFVPREMKACQKIRIKPLKGDRCWKFLRLTLTPKGDYTKTHNPINAILK